LKQQFQRILVVRTDRIGDVILTLPLAEVLKKNFPNAHISVMIRRYTAELAEDNHNVDQILFYDNGNKPLPFFQLVSTLRTQRFDVVIHTYPRFPLALITWIARIPIRVGTGYRWYSVLFNRKLYEHRKDATRHELEYNLNLLKILGCTFDSQSISPSLEVRQDIIEKVKAMLAHKGIQRDEKFIILHPGSSGSARNWSAKNFGILGEQLAMLPNIRVIITGGKNEQELVEHTQTLVGNNAVTFIDELTLKEFAALAKLSSLFIANSTGPLHIAAAVGTAVIGLYPHVVPMTAERWGPVTKKKIIFSPKNQPADCNKCVLENSSACECMETIGINDVFEAAKKLLSVKSEHIEASTVA
jgi:lipopolysaccharide heptosyltransferase II